MISSTYAEYPQLPTMVSDHGSASPRSPPQEYSDVYYTSIYPRFIITGPPYPSDPRLLGPSEVVIEVEQPCPVGHLYSEPSLSDGSLINQPIDQRPMHTSGVPMNGYRESFTYETNEPSKQENEIDPNLKAAEPGRCVTKWAPPMIGVDTEIPNRSKSPIPYNFIIEDPTNPSAFREKRTRTKKELEKQKEDIRQLKEYGGACLECYKNKKKCGPSTPCPACRANRRDCIRKYALSESEHKRSQTPDDEMSTMPDPDDVNELLDNMKTEPKYPPIGSYSYFDPDCDFEDE